MLGHTLRQRSITIRRPVVGEARSEKDSFGLSVALALALVAVMVLSAIAFLQGVFSAVPQNTTSVPNKDTTKITQSSSM